MTGPLSDFFSNIRFKYTSASITYNCFTPDCFCQVEGERLLLVATHKRTAALNEISKLKTEGRIVIGKYTSVMKLPN